MKKFNSSANSQNLVCKQNKWIVLVCLSFCFLFCVVASLSNLAIKTSTQALELEQQTVNAKQELVNRAKHNARTLTQQQSQERGQEYRRILQDNTLDDVAREQALNQIGFYTLQTETQEVASDNSRSSAGDLLMDNVRISYDSVKDEWTLSAFAGWKSHDSIENAVKWPMWEGNKYNVGSPDVAGIVLKGTYGESNGLAIVSGYLESRNNLPSDTNSNRWAGLDTPNGAVYELQDYDKVTWVGFLGTEYRYSYNMYAFYTQVTYNSAFVNYHGRATLFYGHTWEDTKLTSINVSLMDLGGGVSWTNQNVAWYAMSPGDKLF